MENQREQKRFSAIKKRDIYLTTHNKIESLQTKLPIIQLCIFLHRHGDSQSASGISIVLLRLRHSRENTVNKASQEDFCHAYYTEVNLFETSLFTNFLKRNFTRKLVIGST